MNRKTYLVTAASIFTFAGGLHILRVLMGWELVIGGWPVPAWLSVIVGVIALSMAYQGIQLQGKK